MPGRPPADADQGTAGSQLASQRLDQWLWFARIIKSRTLAATLIEEGKIRVNREKVAKASFVVKPGDVITSGVHRQVRVLKVVAIGKRRGPATEAQALFEDLTPPTVAPSQDQSPAEATVARGAGSGRPTKRDRRLTDRLRGR